MAPIASLDPVTMRLYIAPDHGVVGTLGFDVVETPNGTSAIKKRDHPAP